MQDITLTITLSEQEALDILTLIAARKADLLHKKDQNQIMEWHELRIWESVSSVEAKIDLAVAKSHHIGWTPAEDVPALKLVRDGKATD